MTGIQKIIGHDVRELEQEITGLKHLIATTRTTITNDRVYEEARASHLAAIELHQRQLAQLEEARANGPEIIERAKERIDRCRQLINACKNRPDIERLLKAAATLAALEAEELEGQVADG